MKRIILLLAAALVLPGCVFSVSNGTFKIGKNKLVIGSGVEASKTFDVAPFAGIKVVGSTDVIFTQGPQSVELVTDDNLLDYYEISVSGDILVVSVKSGVSMAPETDDVVKVSCPDLRSGEIVGSGDLEVKGLLATQGDLSLTVAGSGDIDVAALECGNFSVKLSGSGDVDIDSLVASGCSIVINGSGDVDINCKVSGDISATVNGSGDITLAGSANSVSSRVNGSGEVSTAGLTVNK